MAWRLLDYGGGVLGGTDAGAAVVSFRPLEEVSAVRLDANQFPAVIAIVIVLKYSRHKFFGVIVAESSRLLVLPLLPAAAPVDQQH